MGSAGGARLLAVMLLLGWEKAFDETGDERAWWSGRVAGHGARWRWRDGSVQEIGLLSDDLEVQRLERGVAGDVRADLRMREARHLGVDEHRGAAASARSCASQVRSMVANQKTASSTEWPAVRRPWLRRITALLPPRACADALALLLVDHDARVVVEERVVLEERARILGERVEESPQR